MDRWEGKVAIVTGASAGIGAAIAEELVKSGLVVVGLARRVERLEKLSASLKDARGKFHGRQCDVRKEEDILSVFKWVNIELGGVDILVNNAGVSSNSRLIDDATESFRNILDVNVMAMAIAIREAVASMKNRDVAGHIININSTAGHEVPTDFLDISLYTASKHAVTAMTETVRKELASEANNKIRITSLSPGVVETEIVIASGVRGGSDFFKTTPYLVPKDISNAVLYVLGTPQNVQVGASPTRLYVRMNFLNP